VVVLVLADSIAKMGNLHGPYFPIVVDPPLFLTIYKGLHHYDGRVVEVVVVVVVVVVVDG